MMRSPGFSIIHKADNPQGLTALVAVLIHVVFPQDVTCDMLHITMVKKGGGELSDKI